MTRASQARLPRPIDLFDMVTKMPVTQRSPRASVPEAIISRDAATPRQLGSRISPAGMGPRAAPTISAAMRCRTPAGVLTPDALGLREQAQLATRRTGGMPSHERRPSRGLAAAGVAAWTV